MKDKPFYINFPEQVKNMSEEEIYVNAILHYWIDFRRNDLDKKIETSLLLYGTKHANQNEDVKDKIKDTCLEKYGVENCFQSKEIIEKFMESLNETNKMEFKEIIKLIEKRAKR